MRSRSWLLLMGLLTAACKDPAGDVDNERVPGRSTTSSSTSRAGAQATQAGQAATTTSQGEGTASPSQKPQRAKASSITWEGPVAWKTWDEGLKLAQSTNRPILLMVYADWCPHCRELKPVFLDPEVVKLSERLVMIRQDADEDPAWLKPKVGHLGSYVPRMFFLKPDGTVQADINSGNARFPYFYTPQGIEALKGSMKRAAGSLGGSSTTLWGEGAPHGVTSRRNG
jgi:thiol-disulfide isomerase/thioredoxin